MMGQSARCQRHRNLLFGLVAILLAGIILLVGCSDTSTSPPPSTQIPFAVPQRADLLAEIELAEILDDEDFAELYQAIAAQSPALPRTLDAALDNLEYGTGIDLRDLTHVIVFADAEELVESMESASGSSPPYWGALVEGELNENTIIHGIESRMGQELAISSYQNHTLYSLADSHNQGDALNTAFLAEEQMVIGTSLAVKDVIDVTVGLQEPISGTVYDLYCQLGDALTKLASYVPESLTSQIPAEIPLGPVNLSMLSFRDVGYTTLALTKSEAIITADVHLEFTNSDSAKTSGQLLWIAITASKYIVSDPDIGELLSKVHTSTSSTSVSLTASLTISEIERLASMILGKAD